MSNRKNEKGFYINVALIVIVLAAIIYIVVSGSMPESADIPEIPDVNVETETETENEAEAEAETEKEAEYETEAAEDDTVTE